MTDVMGNGGPDYTALYLMAEDENKKLQAKVERLESQLDLAEDCVRTGQTWSFYCEQEAKAEGGEG